MKLKTTFLWTMVLSLGLAAALGIYAIVFEAFGRLGEQILVTSLDVGVFSLIALICAYVLDRRRVRPLMWFGIGMAALAMTLWLILVWANVRGTTEDLIIKSGAAATTLSAWSAHYGLLILLPLNRDAFRFARVATLIVAALLAVAIIAVVWTEEFEDWTGKIVAVLSILTACGTVVTPVLAGIERLNQRDEVGAIGPRLHVALACPRCGHEHEPPVGVSRCPRCGLRMVIDVEEPRCACGYLLYRLEGDTCPECGKAVPEKDRWASARRPASRPAP